MEDSQKAPKDILLPGSIIVAALLISGALVYNIGSRSLDPAVPEAQADVTKMDLVDDDVIVGSADAPVTIVEFGDYQCPFCARFFTDVEPRLREDYIKTGKARMVYRDFAFLGPESADAAMASQCAAEQKAFWSFHDALFATEVRDGVEHNGNLNEQLFKTIASGLKLDRALFDNCLSSKKYFKEIEKDYNDGIAAGVRGTPATFINGKMISGAASYDSFKSAVDEALKAVK